MKSEIKIPGFWKNIAPKWFNFVEWLVLSSAILLGYVKTNSNILKTILVISYFVFWFYLASQINNFFIRTLKIKNSIMLAIIAVVISFIMALLIADFVVIIVADISLGTI